MPNLKFMHFYHSYLDAIEPLSDVERGRLFTTCLQYSKTGVASGLNGNERFVFPLIKAQIDRDNEAYLKKCQQNSEKGKRGGRPPKKSDEGQDSEKSHGFSEKAKKAVAFLENPEEKSAEKLAQNLAHPVAQCSDEADIKADVAREKKLRLFLESQKSQGEGEGEGEIKEKRLAQPEVAPNSDTPPPKPKKPRKSGMVLYSEPFLRFWEVYPRREDKQRAFEIWSRLEAADHERVVTAAKNYAAKMRSQETEVQYIRLPKTFLNKGGWEDWVTGPPGAENGVITDAERAAIIAKHTNEGGERDDRAIIQEIWRIQHERNATG
jgi:hypothetical protein